MFKCGDTREDAITNMENQVREDLNKLLETVCTVSFIEDKNTKDHESSRGHTWSRPIPQPVFDHDLYNSLEYTISEDLLDSIEFDTYQETPELLEVLPNSAKTNPPEIIYWRSGLLKSNCRVTSQPDWGDVYIRYTATKQLTQLSLLKYIVSFRDECHFHEEICETIYKRLYEALEPSELCVTCLYARRGGIDINPVRASSPDLISGTLIDSNKMHFKTQKQ